MTRTALPLATALLLPLAAGAAPPTVESVAPAVGQRGTEFTLTLTGARLTGAEELLLYEPGVVCTRLAAASPSEAARIAAKLGRETDPKQDLEDLFWALLNTDEFLFNH